MGVAQAIPLVGSLLIARIYVPAEFGMFSAWFGVMTVLAVLLSGRFEAALAIEPDGPARQMAVAATLATICASSLVSMGALIPIAWFVSGQTLSAALILTIVPASFMMAVGQTWQSWAAAEGLYRQLSLIRIWQAMVVTASQLLFGLISPTAESLAVGQLVGLLVAIVVSSRLIPLRLKGPLSRTEFLLQVLSFWKRHRKMPLFSLPADFINIVSGQMPLFFINSRFGADAGGVYALALRIIGGPISLLGAAVLDVFKRRAATAFRENGHCRVEYRQTFLLLGAAGLALAFGIWFAAEWFFAFAFGEPWREAGTVALWLAPMFALRFVASPLSYIFYIVGAQRTDLVWQFALLCMTLITMIWSADFQTSVVAYSAGYSGLYIVYLLMSAHYSRGARA